MSMATKKKSKRPVVLIRTFSAGVHVGELVHRDATTVTLANAHRIWRWRGANTLSELSQKGASTSVFTRISEAVPEIALQWIEVILCSGAAAANLRIPRWL